MTAREKELNLAWTTDLATFRPRLRKLLKVAMASVPLIIAIIQAASDFLDEIERTEP